MNVLFSFTTFVLGLLLIIIILTNNRQTTAKLLAFFIFTIAYNNLLNFLWGSQYVQQAYLLYTGPLVAYLRLPCLYFYVLFTFNDKRTLQWKDANHLIPATIYLTYFFSLFLSDTGFKQALFSNKNGNERQILLFIEGWLTLPWLQIAIRSIVTLLYITLLLGLWKRYRPHISSEVSNNRQVLNWIKVVIAIFLTNGLLGIFIGIYPSATLIWIAAIWRSLSYCGVVCVGLFFLPNILYGTAKASIVEDIDKVRSTAPSEENANFIKSRIAGFIEKKGFLQKQIKLADLANQIGVQPYVLSAYINQVYQLRFNDFINLYRIQYISEGLLKDEWGQLTLEAIGERGGFTNRTTFLNAFKKFKGTTPTLFLHQHRFGSKQHDETADGE